MLAQVFVLDPLLEEDGVTGDQYGPYDPAFVASERERLRDDKVRALSRHHPAARSTMPGA